MPDFLKTFLAIRPLKRHRFGAASLVGLVGGIFVSMLRLAKHGAAVGWDADAWTAYWAGVIVFVTLANVGATGLQWIAMNRSIVASARAWVGVIDLKPTYHPGMPIHIAFTLKNFSQCPSKDIHVRVRWEVLAPVLGMRPLIDDLVGGHTPEECRVEQTAKGVSFGAYLNPGCEYAFAHGWENTPNGDPRFRWLRVFGTIRFHDGFRSRDAQFSFIKQGGEPVAPWPASENWST